MSYITDIERSNSIAFNNLKILLTKFLVLDKGPCNISTSMSDPKIYGELLLMIRIFSQNLL